MNDSQKCAEGEVVKYRTHQAEGNHEFANGLNVPTLRMLNHFKINPVVGDGHFGKIGHKICEQDRLWQQWKKGQEKRYPRHAEHVSKICACSHENILERVS